MVDRPDDVSWVPRHDVRLSSTEVAEVMRSLRALVDGTRSDEPNRAHVVTIAVIVTRAIERSEEGGEP